MAPMVTRCLRWSHAMASSNARATLDTVMELLAQPFSAMVRRNARFDSATLRTAANLAALSAPALKQRAKVIALKRPRDARPHASTRRAQPSALMFGNTAVAKSSNSTLSSCSGDLYRSRVLCYAVLSISCIFLGDIRCRQTVSSRCWHQILLFIHFREQVRKADTSTQNPTRKANVPKGTEFFRNPPQSQVANLLQGGRLADLRGASALSAEDAALVPDSSIDNVVD